MRYVILSICEIDAFTNPHRQNCPWSRIEIIPTDIVVPKVYETFVIFEKKTHILTYFIFESNAWNNYDDTLITPTRAGLRRALASTAPRRTHRRARSWWRDSRNVLVRLSVSIFNPNPWPWPLTLTFNRRRARLMKCRTWKVCNGHSKSLQYHCCF